jgi:hypothetical protein
MLHSAREEKEDEDKTARLRRVIEAIIGFDDE